MERTRLLASVLERRAAADRAIGRLPTGCPALDLALGGGLSRGRLVEIFGAESTGKTTLALQIAARAQSEGGAAAFLDIEHCFDLRFARRLGVDPDRFLLARPASGDEALVMAEALLRSQALEAVILDSAAALAPLPELQTSSAWEHPGLHARLLGHGLRRLATAARRTAAVLIVVNQVRSAPGGEGGLPAQSAGGSALPLYASQRIELTPRSSSPGDEFQFVVARVVKNRYGEPFRKAVLALTREGGFCPEEEWLQLGMRLGCVECRAGVWFCEGVRLGAGRAEARRGLQVHAALRERLARQALARPPVGEVPPRSRFASA